MAERVRALEERLGIPLGDPATALAAVTHKSWCNEHKDARLADNERLEFLGDAVIGLGVSHRLMERYPTSREGELSRLRAAIVDEEGLARVARRLRLGELLLLGRGEELSGGRDKPSLLADAMEAVAAAAYLAGGMQSVLAIVDRFLGDAIAQAGAVVSDHKTALQELAQGALRRAVRYRVTDERGPDHDKVFQVEVTLDNEIAGHGEGRTKKDAEQAAAKDALDTLARAGAVPPSGGGNSNSANGS